MTFYRRSFSATARHVTQGLQHISGFEVGRIGVTRCRVSWNEEPEEIGPGNGVGRQLEFLPELHIPDEYEFDDPELRETFAAIVQHYLSSFEP